MNDYPTSLERRTVVDILQYLIDMKKLKVDSIEGLDEHLQSLENMVKDCFREKGKQFAEYATYWAGMNHRNNHAKDAYEDCLAESCISIRQTVEEFR